MERPNALVVVAALAAVGLGLWALVSFHGREVVTAGPVVDRPVARHVERVAVDHAPPMELPADAPAIVKRAAQAGARVSCTHVDGKMDCGACLTDNDCPEGQGCTLDVVTKRTVCLASDCRVDADCGADKRCLPLRYGDDGATATRCYPVGTKRVDETCGGMHEQGTECAAGLVCTAGLCRPACKSSADCADGETCQLTPAGASCDVTSCEHVTCAAGEHCARGICHTGVDCSDPHACQPGYRCTMHGLGKHWSGVCSKPCRNDDTCGAGSICVDGSCEQMCELGVPQGCPDGTVCSSQDPSSGRFGCRPL